MNYIRSSPPSLLLFKERYLEYNGERVSGTISSVLFDWSQLNTKQKSQSVFSSQRQVKKMKVKTKPSSVRLTLSMEFFSLSSSSSTVPAAGSLDRPQLVCLGAISIRSSDQFQATVSLLLSPEPSASASSSATASTSAADPHFRPPLAYKTDIQQMFW